MNPRPFSACAVIPCFDHGAQVEATVQRVLQHGLPIVLVDDGSGRATADVLDAITQRHGAVRLVRRAINGGKGAAVMDGLRAAHAAGYTHALQIDADGQHDTNDIPRFLACGSTHPEALICGEPRYDETVPKARLYARYLTHFWVWIETLSFGVRDSMCGFRLYPLARTIALLDRVALPPRMDFDVEVMVRLVWDGVPMIWLPTGVVYPPGGLSHFRAFRDNLRISWMHTRLVAGMLWRAPLLLWRRFASRTAAAPSRGWAQLAERGSAWGIVLVAWAYRILGRTVARLVLVPAVAWFFVTGRDARAASRGYLERLRAFAGEHAAPAPTAPTIFGHIMAFAESGLDKLAAWSGQIDLGDVDICDRAEFERLERAGGGALFIGAHLGNLEMARALGVRQGALTVNAIVYTAHARRFVAALTRANAAVAENVVEVDAFGPDTAIALRERIQRGEVLVIAGDRTPPAENGRVVAVEFLGAPAEFPEGPFVLAHILECPVYLLVCLRESGRYRVYLEKLADRIQLPRGARGAALKAHVGDFAHRLERYCLRAPLQWFNFYDFWRSSARNGEHRGSAAKVQPPAQRA
jgi:predicted LPLAT superfamily acyltransferase/glycosyltransferase involved in cell wall biosynthesis